jgi:hypothetical protein
MRTRTLILAILPTGDLMQRRFKDGATPHRIGLSLLFQFAIRNHQSAIRNSYGFTVTTKAAFSLKNFAAVSCTWVALTASMMPGSLRW